MTWKKVNIDIGTCPLETHVLTVGEYRLEVAKDGSQWRWHYERVIETRSGYANTKEDAMKDVLDRIKSPFS